METRADPHRIGVDQLADNVGALLLRVAALDDRNWLFLVRGRNSAFVSFPQLRDQVLRLLILKPVFRAVALLAARCLVQILETVPAIGILTDGEFWIAVMMTSFDLLLHKDCPEGAARRVATARRDRAHFSPCGCCIGAHSRPAKLARAHKKIPHD